MRVSRECFVRQQGFTTPNPDRHLYEALMFQPRIVGCLAAIGVLLQSGRVFLALSAVLWWGTLLPGQNLFDATYNYLVARPRGLPRLTVAPTPRRFAQAVSATMAFAIAAAALSKAAVTAWVLEGLFLWAVIAVVFGRICTGTNLYYLLRRLSGSGVGDRRLTEIMSAACADRGRDVV